MARGRTSTTFQHTPENTPRPDGQTDRRSPHSFDYLDFAVPHRAHSATPGHLDENDADISQISIDPVLLDSSADCLRKNECSFLPDSVDTNTGANWLPLTITFLDLSCHIPARKRLFARKKSTQDKPVEDLKGDKNFVAVEMNELNTPASPQSSSITDDSVGKVVLCPFSGTLKPGELVAVMGPSGSGKTTFLEVLANRVPKNRISGEIFVNGVPSNDAISRKCFGYVWQHDALHENLTVKETLEYVCRLRFNYGAEEVRVRVREVMDELGLNNCANTRVGGQSFRGISGGERKRVSIAIELLANPSVLFLDEPTTGLDSCTALHIVQTLKNLAAKNRTVVCTIHQPQTSIYRLFDKILLMSRGGRVVYFGDGSDTAVEYFEKLGFSCDEFTNPSDHFLDIINTFPRKKKGHKKRKKIHDEANKHIAPPTPSSPSLPSFYSAMTDEGRVDFLVASYQQSQLCHKNTLAAQLGAKSAHRRDESEVSISPLAGSPPGSSNPSMFSSMETLVNNTQQTRAQSLERFPSLGETPDSPSEGLEIDTTNIPLPVRKSSVFSMPKSPAFTSLKRSLSIQLISMKTRKSTTAELLSITNQKNAPNWFTKFYVLSLRQLKEYSRNKTATIFRLLQSALIGTFIGLIYFQVGTEYDQKAAQDRRGVLFFLSLQQAMLGCITVMTLFHGWERIVFQREYSSSLYGSFTYYFSKFLSELPFQVISPILFGFITYFMVGLSQTVNQFLIFMACLILTTLCGQAAGIAISVWSPSLDIANIMAPLMLGLTMLCGGFFITVSNVPDWLFWTTQIDFVTYSNQILSVNDLTGLNFTCDPMSTPPTFPNMTKTQKFWYGITRPFRKQQPMQLPPQYANVTVTPCLFKTGEDLLKSMSFQDVNITYCFFIILLMTIGLHLFAFIGLRFYVAGKLRK